MNPSLEASWRHPRLHGAIPGAKTSAPGQLSDSRGVFEVPSR
ncbi:hypothetical protein [Halorhodospira halochloris]|nr:hypothetical protein [Halorhodospira halochloris]